jgi:LPXTG-motif cell wall-anchored protein
VLWQAAALVFITLGVVDAAFVITGNTPFEWSGVWGVLLLTGVSSFLGFRRRRS